ncbi:hypothetical protein ACHAQH_009262 [Verticillium albo-atrum]
MSYSGLLAKKARERASNRTKHILLASPSMSSPLGSASSCNSLAEEHRRKRIKLFDSANKDETTTDIPHRHIKSLDDLTDFELLSLRNIIVQCSKALESARKPGPEVVESILQMIFDNSWTSERSVAETPLLKIGELPAHELILYGRLEEALRRGYVLVIGKRSDNSNPVYSHADLDADDPCSYSMQLRIRHQILIGHRYFPVATKDIIWTQDPEDVAARTADLCVSHDQLIIDQLRLHNVRIAVLNGQQTVKQFAIGKPADPEQAKQWPPFLKFDSPDVQKHLISSMFPRVLSDRARDLEKGIDIDILDAVEDGQSIVWGLLKRKH